MTPSLTGTWNTTSSGNNGGGSHRQALLIELAALANVLMNTATAVLVAYTARQLRNIRIDMTRVKDDLLEQHTSE